MVGDLQTQRAEIVTERGGDVAVVAVTPRPAPSVRTMMGGPIELQAAAQAGPRALQQVVLARFVDEAVQRQLRPDAGAVVAGVDGGEQRVVATAELGAKAIVAAAPHLLEGEDLERR